jgi:KipI family sensor histidine kinase inhibitor
MPDHAKPVTQKWPAIHTLGVDGVLVRFGDQLTEPANRAALAFRAALERAEIQGVEETSTALTSAYLRFDLRAVDHETLLSAVHSVLQQEDWYAAPLPTGRKLWRVPAVFGTDHGPQLDEAAAHAGLSSKQAIAELCAAPMRVQAIGFAPGQPYLGQLPENWDIPRQTDLTPHVPEGALAVAIRQMVLFSVSTPTGWRHVGQTAVRLFRPDQPDPFMLRPGDEVQLLSVTRDEFETLRQADPTGGATAQGLA